VALLGTLAACDSNPASPHRPKAVRYVLVGPPDATALRRGDPVEVTVRVVDGPEHLGATLMMGVNFFHPDGRPDNSYLPGVPTDNGAAPYPITLSVRFTVPVGTPEGNSFIPPGSRVTGLRVGLYCYEGTDSRGPGIIATYPVID
jgi:hypothetical protein